MVARRGKGRKRLPGVLPAEDSGLRWWWKLDLQRFPVFVGLLEHHKTGNSSIHPELVRRIRGGEDFLYADHAYFVRSNVTFRLVRGELHPTRILDRPGDRLKAWGIRVSPYQQGSRVIVIPPSRYQIAVYGAEGWLDKTLEELKSSTDRPVVVKTDKAIPLAEYLKDAWCFVTFASAAGVTALISGVPVFAGPYCPCLPVSSGGLKDIESPVLHDRMPWLRSLAYCQWHLSELHRIDWKEYRYL